MGIFESGLQKQVDANEVLALGRMVSYICQRSKELNLDTSTYFLEMALMSLVKDIDKSEIQIPAVERAAEGAELH